MRIYRGDAGIYNARGRLQVSYFRIGRMRLRAKESFSTDRKIAEEFAFGIAEHYGPSYIPVLITANVPKIEKPDYYDLEKEVFPVGVIEIESIEEL